MGANLMVADCQALKDDSRRLMALSIYHSINDGSLALFASALPVMRVGLGLDFLQIGTILGAGLLATMLLQLLFGSMSDRGHSREVLTLGFAGVVLADLVFPISSAFADVLVCYVFLRSTAAVYHPVSFASIGRTFHEKKTAAFGYQAAVGDLGLTVATLATGVLSETWGWRVPFWTWGAFGGLLFAYFIRTILTNKITFHGGSTHVFYGNETPAANPSSSRSIFAVLTLVSSITTVSFIIFTGYMPLYFNMIEGFSPAWSSSVVAVWIAIGVGAGFMTGRIVDRFGGESRTLRTMFAVESALFLIANLAFYVDWPNLPASLMRQLAVALTSIPIFVTFPAVSSLLGMRMPHRRLGLTYAINLSLGLVAASGATYLTGYLASTASIAVILPMLLIVAILGTIASFKL